VRRTCKSLRATRCRPSGYYPCGNQNYTARSRHRRDACSMAWRCRFLVHATHWLICAQAITRTQARGLDRETFSHCTAGDGGRCAAAVRARVPGERRRSVWKSKFYGALRHRRDAGRESQLWGSSAARRSLSVDERLGSSPWAARGVARELVTARWRKHPTHRSMSTQATTSARRKCTSSLMMLSLY
jgi:hypothetical protein